MSYANVAEKYGHDLALALRSPEPQTLYLPYEPGVGWFAPDRDGFRIGTQGTVLYGDGIQGEDVGLRYWADPAIPELKGTGDSTLLRIAANNVHLHDLVLSNNRGPVTGTGNGIIHSEPLTLVGLKLERVTVLYSGKNCLRLDPWAQGQPNEYNVSPSIRDCVFFGARADGVVVINSNAGVLDHVSSTRHGGRGFTLIGCNNFALVNGCVAENMNGGILLKDCAGCVIDAAHIESFGAQGEPGIILDNCRGCTVKAGFGDWSGKLPTSILLRNGTTRCTIEQCAHARVGLTVDDGGCRDNVIHRQTWPAWQAPIPWKVSSRRNTVIG